MAFRSDPIPEDPLVVGEILVRRQYIPRPPAVLAVRSAALGVPSSTWKLVWFDGADLVDTAFMHDPVTNSSRLVVVTPGLYDILGWVSWDLYSVGQRAIRIRLNGGSAIRQISENATSAIVGNDMEVSILNYPLDVGDYVELEIWQNIGAGLNTDAANFAMRWVAMPT